MVNSISQIVRQGTRDRAYSDGFKRPAGGLGEERPALCPRLLRSTRLRDGCGLFRRAAYTLTVQPRCCPGTVWGINIEFEGINHHFHLSMRRRHSFNITHHADHESHGPKGADSLGRNR